MELGFRSKTFQSDDPDILRQRRYLSSQGNVLLRKFHMCSIGVRLALFRSFLFSYVYVTTMVEL